MKHFLTVCSFALLVLSCGARRGTTIKTVDNTKGERVEPRTPRSKTPKKESVKKETVKVEEVTITDTPEVYASPTDEYIAIFSDIAQDEMRMHGVPASITLAQGILESGSGKGRLSIEANNHFGIKCHGWEGEKIYHDDDKDQECFRKYKNAKYSFRDHSLFLKDRSRYAQLFQLKQDDYKGWAKGLRAAGYATDRKYPAKLISLIERYQLHRFDSQVLGTNVVNDKHTIVPGDTLYSLSKKYAISVEELKALNGLEDNTLHVGQILFVKPLPKD